VLRTAHRAFGVPALVLALPLLLPGPASGQAFTAPKGVGSVTFAWQYVDNTGHRGTDGFFIARGQSVTTSALVEVDYSISDRLAVGFGVPYVFAKYTGAMPPRSGLPVDSCGCWNSAFQDLSFSGRYRFGSDVWAITPLVAYGQPSHDYPFQGEAVVGKNLKEVRVGISAGLKLANLLPKASLQGTYSYAFVEKALDDIKIDRSNLSMDFGYALTERLFLRGGGVFQRTHGGLRAGSASGHPFPLPGELNTPERRAQADRLIRTNYWQLAAGAAFSAGPVDLFGSYTKYIWGRDAHNGQAFTFGTTWYFELGS
jgi:hypothetical protein